MVVPTNNTLIPQQGLVSLNNLTSTPAINLNAGNPIGQNTAYGKSITVPNATQPLANAVQNLITNQSNPNAPATPAQLAQLAALQAQKNSLQSQVNAKNGTGTQNNLSTAPYDPTTGLVNPASGYSTTPGPYNVVTGQLNPGQTAPQTTPQTPTPQVTPTPSNAGSSPANFPGIVSTLANTSNVPTPGFIQAQGTAQTATQNLMNSVPQQNANVQTASQGLQDLKNQYATDTNQIQGSPGLGLSEASGQQGLLNNLYSTKENTAEQAVTNALSANAQQQTAYNEAGGLANTTQGQATGQQSAQQSGLAAAGALAAPQAGQNPASQSYNPLTGQYSGLAGLSAGGNSGLTAQQALAIVGQTLGGETAGANLVPLQQALAAGQGASDNITSYLQQNPDLNSSTLNLVNLAAQWASGQYSGANAAKYQTLGNYLTTFATQMAPLLAPGGTSTDAVRALQQSLVSGSANNQTIQQVLAQLTAEAKGTLANRTSGAGGGGTVSSGSSITSVPGGTNPVIEGTTQSIGGNNYVYTNGKWVPQ
jgi:hypothetical protein